MKQAIHHIINGCENVQNLKSIAIVYSFQVGGSGQMALHCNPMEKPWYL